MSNVAQFYNDYKAGKLDPNRITPEGRKAISQYEDSLASKLITDIKGGKATLDRVTPEGFGKMTEYIKKNPSILSAQEKSLFDKYDTIGKNVDKSKFNRPVVKINEPSYNMEQLGKDIKGIGKITGKGALDVGTSLLDAAVSVPGMVAQGWANIGEDMRKTTAKQTGIPQPVTPLQDFLTKFAQTSNKMTIDSYNKNMKVNENLRQDMSPAAQEIGNVGSSLAQIPAHLATGGLTMFTTPAQQGYAEALAKGKSQREALPIAIGKGATEYVTEKLPLGIIGDMFKSKVGKNIVKYIGADWIGENLANLGSNTIDELAYGNKEEDVITKLKNAGQLTLEQMPETTRAVVGTAGTVGVFAKTTQTINKLREGKPATPQEIVEAVDDIVNKSGKSFEQIASESMSNMLRTPEQITPDTVQNTEEGQIKLPEFGTEQPKKIRKLKVSQQMELEGIKEYDLSKTPKKITKLQTKLQQEQFGLTKKQLAESRKTTTPVEPAKINTKQFVQNQIESLTGLTDIVDKIKSGEIEVKDLSKLTSATIERSFRNITSDRNVRQKLYDEVVTPILIEPKKQATTYILENINNLKENVVDKFDIKAGSKESFDIEGAFRGTKTMQDLTAKYGAEKANNILEAGKWLRGEYDKFYDAVNEIRVARGKEPFANRDTYFRHYSNPNLLSRAMDISETGSTDVDYKAIEKSLSFMRKREGDGGSFDAITGFTNYVPQLAREIYLNPKLDIMRRTAHEINKASDYKLKNFEKKIKNHADLLAGDKLGLDDWLSKAVGDNNFTRLMALGQLSRLNKVTYKTSTIVSQLLNLPNGAAQLARGNTKEKLAGVGSLATSMIDIVNFKNAESFKALSNSPLMKERYLDLTLDKYSSKGKFLDVVESPRKLVELMDGLTSSIIYVTQYNKGKLLNVKDATAYADKMTREAIGGRGYGEKSLLQQSEVYKNIAPFSLELGNTMTLLKDIMGEKDAFAIIVYLLAVNSLTDLIVKLTGNRGGQFDYINVLKKVNSGELKKEELGGALLATTLNSLPLGSYIAEFGMTEDDREKYLGSDDPTRFGTGGTLASDLRTISSDIMKGDIGSAAFNTATSFSPLGGGQQVRSTAGGLSAYQNVDEQGNVYQDKGKTETLNDRLKNIDTMSVEQVQNALIKYNVPNLDKIESLDEAKEILKNFEVPMERITNKTSTSPWSKLKAGLFSKNAVEGLSGYQPDESKKLGEEETRKYNKLVKENNIDPNKLMNIIMQIKSMNRNNTNLRQIINDSALTENEKALIYQELRDK